MKQKIACVVMSLAGACAAAAEPCIDNFKAEGNLLTGKTYKTHASLPGVKQADAFQRAQVFTASNGFTILSAEKEAGVLSAAQAVSLGQGKNVPLNIIVQPEGDGVRMSIHYATSGGVMSPEGAIKKHFCMTIAAAASGPAGAAPAQAEQSTAPNAAPAQRSAMRGFAAITPAQQQAVRGELSKTMPTDAIRKLASDAAPAIASFIERVACLADYNAAGTLNEFAVPGRDLTGTFVVGRPMGKAKYHDKSSCMTVTRVHGWSAPANNALRFEVLYKADDSGEIAKLTHETIRQPDGVWLFSQ